MVVTHQDESRPAKPAADIKLFERAFAEAIAKDERRQGRVGAVLGSINAAIDRALRVLAMPYEPPCPQCGVRDAAVVDLRATWPLKPCALSYRCGACDYGWARTPSDYFSECW